MAGQGSLWRGLASCRYGAAKAVVMAMAVALVMTLAVAVFSTSQSIVASGSRSADWAGNTAGVGQKKVDSVRITWHESRELRLEKQPEVMTTNFTLGSGNDSFEGYIVKPRDGRVKAVTVLLTDVMGLPSKYTVAFAERLSATSRYVVVVPDLFRGNPFDMEAADAPLEAIMKWFPLHPEARVAADIQKTITYSIQTFGKKLPLGILGFCFGGGKVLSTLARDRGRTIKAGVSFYGSPLNVTDTVNIRAPVLMILAGNDSFVDPAPFYEAKKLMDSVPSPIPSQILLYPNMPHAFAHEIKPGNEKSARQAFRASRMWFKKYFKA